jgi:heme oxygenase
MTSSTAIQQSQTEGDSKPKTTTTTTTAPSSPLSTSQCPYAVALSEDEASSHGGDAVPHQIAAELSHCPAFQAPQNNGGNNSNNGSHNKPVISCPFKEAKSAEEVQKTLAQIPKSHHSDQGAFYQVMQHLHQQLDKEFVQKNLPLDSTGQCPMQPYLDSKVMANAKANHNFAQALEDCSLSAIMGRLAADMERHEQEKDDENPEEETTNSTYSTGNGNGNGQKVGVEGLNPVEEKAEKEPKRKEQTQQHQQHSSLANALKTGTAASHQAAEDVHFVRNFIRGQIDRELYQALILSLYHVYVALEGALDQHAPHHFASCHFPDALCRVPALREDLEFWHNATDPSPRTISPATQDYIDRMDYLSKEHPLLLLAHSYTRYLGDLSGGRVLARVARKALDLDKETGEGLAFYHFEHVDSYKQFKDEYRQALDELPLTTQQIQALVAEANVAFCLNMRLFQELDVQATIPGARVMSLEEVMAYAHKVIEEEEEKTGPKDEDKCPFLVNKKQQQQPLTGTVATQSVEKRCPWPFIFAHDPVQGLKDWQTWAFVFIVIAVWFQLS